VAEMWLKKAVANVANENIENNHPSKKRPVIMVIEVLFKW
jgi:hypothetical protein